MSPAARPNNAALIHATITLLIPVMNVSEENIRPQG